MTAFQFGSLLNNFLKFWFYTFTNTYSDVTRVVDQAHYVSALDRILNLARHIE